MRRRQMWRGPAGARAAAAGVLATGLATGLTALAPVPTGAALAPVAQVAQAPVVDVWVGSGGEVAYGTGVPVMIDFEGVDGGGLAGLVVSDLRRLSPPAATLERRQERIDRSGYAESFYDLVPGDYAIDVEFDPDDPAYSTASVRIPVTVVRARQEITLTTPAPWTGHVGETWHPGARGGASGHPVVVSTSTPGVCVVDGSSVRFVAVGACSVDFAQEGDDLFEVGRYGALIDVVAATTTPPPEPVIVARLSRQPAGSGWFTQPVMVRFRCSSPVELLRPCPEAVRLTDGADQRVVRRIRTVDGRVARVVVDDLDVDTTDPIVRIEGSLDEARCVARDATAGVAVCRLSHSVVAPGVVRLFAEALDRAGHLATATRRYRL